MGSTIEQIESYFVSVEEFLSSSLTSVAPDLPHLREVAYRVWNDITRFGPPSLPRIPSLGSFEIPPPPPPPVPTPPPSLWEWLSDHKWIVVGASAGLISSNILLWYSVPRLKQYYARLAESRDGKRHQIVVVLGADHPLGLSLILGLEAQGYLVYATVSSKQAGEVLQSKSKGYTLPLVLDLDEPASVNTFLKSLTSARLMRFPLTASGDPYALTHTSCYLQSIISLAALFPPPTPCPVESVPLTDSYLPYLTRSHITPLHAVQGLLPQLRQERASVGPNIRGSIVFCVPAIASRVGVPFTSQESMSAAATIRGAEILRRELQVIDAHNDSNQSPSPKVVIIDVGAVGYSNRVGSLETPASADDPQSLTRSWSESEKEAYSASFKASIEQARLSPRNPVHTSAFVNAVINVVSQGTRGKGYGYGYREDFSFATGKRLFLEVWGRIHNWVRGDRFGIGSGATAYSLVSYLPPTLVDKLLYIPHAIIAMRHFLNRASPTVSLPSSISTQAPAPLRPPPPRLIENIDEAASHMHMSSTAEESGHNSATSDVSSEADVESLSGQSHASGSERDLHVLLDSWIDINDGSRSGSLSR